MDFTQYDKNHFRCLVPDYCKVKSDAPALIIQSKNQKKKQTFLTIQISPDDSIIEGIETQIQYWVATNDEHATRSIIRRGEFKNKWSGIEMVTQINWHHDMSIEYGWWLVLNDGKNKICVQLACIGDFSEEEKDWLKMFNSFEVY